MVVVAMCLGLRRSELAGLKWSDFDWIRQEVLIQRGVRTNRVDAIKTKKSKSRLPIDPVLITVLKNWRRISHSMLMTIACGLRCLLLARCHIT